MGGFIGGGMKSSRLPRRRAMSSTMIMSIAMLGSVLSAAHDHGHNNSTNNNDNINGSLQYYEDDREGSSMGSRKSLFGSIYEAMFLATHARWRPAHVRPTHVIVVDQLGLGHSRTLQGAIDMVAFDNRWRIEILVKPGIYRYTHPNYPKTTCFFRSASNRVIDRFTS
jgi:hypothetical protein